MINIFNNVIVRETSYLFIIFAIWTLMHGISVELYYHYCCPKKPIEYLLVPFYTEMPHCQILHWIQTNSYQNIHTITATSITWISGMIVRNLKLKND